MLPERGRPSGDGGYNNDGNALRKPRLGKGSGFVPTTRRPELLRCSAVVEIREAFASSNRRYCPLSIGEMGQYHVRDHLTDGEGTRRIGPQTRSWLQSVHRFLSLLFSSVTRKG